MQIHLQTLRTVVLTAIVFVCVFAWVASASAKADSFTIEGTVVVQTLDRAGTVQHNFRAPFKVITGDGAWRIRVQYGTAYSETCGFDGKEFRSVLDFNPSDFPAEATKGGTKVATLTLSDYPYHSEPTTRFVWLALFPNPNLVSDGKFIPALWNMPFQNVRSQNLCASNSVWMDESHRRLKQMDFAQRNAGVSFLRSNVFLSSKTSDDEIKHAFDGMRDGGVVATYRVGATTNWGGEVFPLSFEMVVIAGVDNDAPFPTQKYLGTVESIESMSKFSPFAEPSGKLSVRDYRVSARANYVDGLSYSCTNAWPDKTEPFLQDLLRREIPRARDTASRAPANEKTGRKRAPLVVIGFAVASVCGLAFMIRRWRRQG